MNEMVVKMENGIYVTTSNNVAEVLEVRHDHLLRKIDSLLEKFGNSDLGSEFYIESTYVNRGKNYRNFLITEMGIAQLCTAYQTENGNAFEISVKYHKKFQEMKGVIENQQKKLPSTFKEALLLLVEAEEVKEKLQLENSKLTNEVVHKENVIIGLVEDIDLATKRQRLNQIIRHGDKTKIADRYNLLYKEFESKYHLNLQLRLERSTSKPKLKGKMDLIDRELNMIPQLYELTCKIFHSEVESLKSKWFDTIDSSK